MTGGFEAAGDIASGALFGRVVEPRAGEGGGDTDGHGLCLNCGTALVGDFCHACGQNGHVHRTLSSIGHDLAHGAFHFEGKIWRTLPMLVLHPGALTRRYIAGERARFVSPLALFLFFVFLLFATIHTFAGEMDTFDATPQTRAQKAEKLDAKIAKVREQATLAEQKRAKGGPGAPDAADVAALNATANAMVATRNAIAGGKQDDNKTVVFSDVKTGWPVFDRGIDKANRNPGLALYKLQASAYKYSWALIPISVPFVALLFLWRRRFSLYDHTIFVTYSLSFMMLLVTVLIAAGAAGLGAPAIPLIAIFVPPVHMFAQLRGAYSLRKRSALWRTFALAIFATIAFCLFATLLLGLGIME